MFKTRRDVFIEIVEKYFNSGIKKHMIDNGEICKIPFSCISLYHPDFYIYKSLADYDKMFMLLNEFIDTIQNTFICKTFNLLNSHDIPDVVPYNSNVVKISNVYVYIDYNTFLFKKSKFTYAMTDRRITQYYNTLQELMKVLETKFPDYVKNVDIKIALKD